MYHVALMSIKAYDPIMSLTEAIKQTALKHKEQIDKTIIAVTYLGDLVMGASGAEHPYQEAWVKPIKRVTQNLGSKSVSLEIEVVQVAGFLPLPEPIQIAEKQQAA
jgi:hypothetical protein